MMDEKTGQRLFSPKRKSISNNNFIQEDNLIQRRSFSDYLYGYSKKFTQKKEIMSKVINEDYDRKINMKHTNSSTEMLYYRKKVEVFKKIFDTLDREREKTISSFNNNIKHLSPAIQSILDPILTKILYENYRINQEQFVELCNKLYEVIKNIILGTFL